MLSQHKNSWLQLAAIALLTGFMAACTSGGEIGSGGNAVNQDDPDAPVDPDDPGETVALRMGSLNTDTGDFTQGVLNVVQSPIAVGVSTTISADIVDPDGVPFTSPVDISFSAQCAGANVVSPQSTGTNGRASTTYTPDSTCVGADTVTATATANGQSLTASANVEVRLVRMGSFDAGGTFQEGVIAVGQNPIATRGSSALRVDLVDQDGQPFTEQVLSVAFSSQVCVNDSMLDSPVSTVNGIARSTFQDQGCASGEQITDTLSATSSAFGAQLQASGNLTIQPSSLGALEFVSADPTVIGLRGTGGQGVQETSTVNFLVRDDVGDPVEGQTVLFSLDRDTGGVALSDDQGISNADGVVSVVVQSGTVHTTIRVRAEATDPNTNTTIFSQSDQLVITSGIADNDSFSLTAECFNLEAFDFDGVETQVNIRLADRFNNPVPEGTAVAFTTEEGSIDGQCFVDTTGACSVTWRSQGVRPDDGRTTVLATATGEESFFDTNGDGVHQDGEQNRPAQDLEEAFLDRDEDGVFDANGFGANGRQTENRPFTEIASDSNVDFDSNGVHDAASGSFTGLLCESGCDDPAAGTLLNVRDSLTLIFSGSGAVVDGQAISDGDGLNDTLLIIDRDPSDGTTDDFPPGDPAFDNFIALGDDGMGGFIGGASVSLILRDERGQPLPQGTTVVYSSDVGAVNAPTTETVLCTTDDTLLGNLFSFSIDGPEADDEADSGNVNVTVTTPRGIITRISFGISFTPPAVAP